MATHEHLEKHFRVNAAHATHAPKATVAVAVAVASVGVVEVLDVHAGVVAALLLRVREHLVRLGHVLEHALGLGPLGLALARVPVGVPLERGLAVGLLHVLLRAVPLYTKDFVIVFPLGLL
eukprot:CAMPEP_0194688526 /NCGR_PEP_ID=MMETSP0295-20121207/16988_1 /TAXON_ID=39354 /ORGANISM="Heterosigma akashiwo, Strain CCMP2393" /LENGTH=120 /DNA_ID=CAMNT_0039577233 /DNA_START=450 /DNA_END=812 /DNA_ORIENTATION=+